MNSFILIFTALLSLTAFAEHPTAFSDVSVQEQSSLFPESYKNSRDRFVQFFQEFKTHKFQMTNFKVPSQIDADLTVDIAYLAPSKLKNLVIIMTGVHGGEGYAANAVLAQFLQTDLKNRINDETGFLFVHALNPYGFKYFLRTTENNVDLNRNFPVKPEIYSFVNEPYQELRGLLVDEEPLKINSLKNLFMLPRIGWVLVRKSKGYLLQATAGGQYQDEKGLFYGGQKSEPQIAFFAEYLKKTASPYQNIYYVDLHTGYGQKGVLHLFGSGALSEKHKTYTEKIFFGEKIDSGNDKDFYSTSGDSVAFVSALLKDKNVSSMCFEFGTLDSQTTWGGFKSLQTLRFESQGALNGFASKDDQKESLQMSVRMFAPQQEEWRKKVLEQGKAKLSASLDNFFKEVKTSSSEKGKQK